MSKTVFIFFFFMEAVMEKSMDKERRLKYFYFVLQASSDISKEINLLVGQRGQCTQLWQVKNWVTLLKSYNFQNPIIISYIKVNPI